jgi:zinc transport system permease protein
MFEVFTLPFMQRALVAGVLVGLLGSYYGVFIVQRGLSFLGDGLAHAAFGGVALGLLLGVDPLWVAAPFTALAAAGIVWVQQRTRLGGDTTIGIFFAVSMALGIIFLSLRKGYTADAFTYLFGSILSVSSGDLAVTLGVGALAAGTWPLWGRWAYATFDRELAAADRLPVQRDDYLLSVSIAVTVVVAVKIVGIVLIAAFLVIPAATARLLARTFFSMTWISALIGVSTAVAGLWLSYFLDLPSGPVIILAQAGLFLGALARSG